MPWRWLILGIGLLWAACAWAEPITLAWDAVTTNTDATPIQCPCTYIVYWGTTAGSHPNSQNVGNVTKATISGLDVNLIYFFVVTVRDTGGNESAVSAEISGRPNRVTVF